MSDTVHDTTAGTPSDPVLQRLSTLDRFLPVWIVAAMAPGCCSAGLVARAGRRTGRGEGRDVSLPIAIGLLLMMYPVLAKVRYNELDRVTGDRRLLLASLALNWILGPALMFALAWLLLPDLPEYRTGLIIVGLARCIAMVLIWNDLSCGDREAAAVLVAINSVFQILAFAAAGLVLPAGAARVAGPVDDVGGVQRLGHRGVGAGVPRHPTGRRVPDPHHRGAHEGPRLVRGPFLPKIGPVALYGLLFTIVMLFALQGDAITSKPWDVVRIALPLLAYFALMFGGSFLLGMRLRLGYAKTATLAVHRRGQQLRARHRRGHRHLRRHLRPGPGRGRRPADRGPGARRAGLRQPVGAQVLP
jgi:arsenite transporter